MSVLAQPGAFRSGVLGDPAYNDGTLGAAQPGAYRDGSLGRMGPGPYIQPGSYNSGSLGMAQPGAFNSGSLGCGSCSGRAQSGLGTTARLVGMGRGRKPTSGLGRALGAIALDLDLMVGMAGVFGVLYFIDKKKKGG